MASGPKFMTPMPNHPWPIPATVWSSIQTNSENQAAKPRYPSPKPSFYEMRSVTFLGKKKPALSIQANTVAYPNLPRPKDMSLGLDYVKT